MTATVETVVDQITVSNDKILLVRYATITKENGKVIRKKSNNSSFAPGDDVSEQPDIVQSIAQTVWAQ
jgi:hypothetical protein